MNGELIEQLRLELIEALKVKTNWGRNEIINEFDKAAYRALLKIMDKPKKPTEG